MLEPISDVDEIAYEDALVLFPEAMATADPTPCEKKHVRFYVRASDNQLLYWNYHMAECGIWRPELRLWYPLTAAEKLGIMVYAATVPNEEAVDYE